MQAVEIAGNENYARVLGAFAKMRKATVSFVLFACPSICPHATTRLPLNGFSENLLCDDIFEIGREKSGWVKSDKNSGYLQQTGVLYIYDNISLNSF